MTRGGTTAEPAREVADPLRVAPEHVPSFIASRGRFLALLGGVFVLHVGARVITSPTTTLDESEQLVFAQAWRWGYGPQPPLYTWLQIVVFQVFGQSILGLGVLKNALLFATYAFTYASGRLVTRSHAAGIVAALSLFFIPQIAWESQRDLTHSVLVTAVSAATLYLVLTSRERRSPWLYVWLGVACGVGMLSNYNYGLVIGGLLVGALCVRECRPVVLTSWVLASIGIALAITLPHVLWTRENASIVLSTTHKLQVEPEAPVLVAAALATARLVGAWAMQVAGIVLIPLALCWRQRVPVLRGVFRQPTVRFLMLVMAGALGVALLSMFASRATMIKGRWLQPALMCVPLLVVALMGGAVDGRAIRRVVSGAFLVAATVIVLLPGRAWVAGKGDWASGVDSPYVVVARQARSGAAHAPGVVADSLVVGGNLRLLLPDHPVITPQFGTARDTIGQKTALVVFDATWNPKPSQQFQEWASAQELELDLAGVQYVETAWRAKRNKRMRLGVTTAWVGPGGADRGQR